MSRFGFQRAAGFTLIEVLVSTIILAIGLLGLASMQTLALKDNQDAFFYSQASSLAYEMSDRMKVNATEWQKSTIPTPDSVCNDSCNSLAHSCTPTAMATYDYCAWKQNVAQRVSSGATATVALSPVAGGVCVHDASYRCITISWARSSQLGAVATNTFQLEIAP
jgi:type IV pilus assembly protein PilV